MIKLLIGGSPCTYWSIAKTKGREVVAEGQGCKLVRINSALVSAQKRDRFYVCNWEVEQPVVMEEKE